MNLCYDCGVIANHLTCLKEYNKLAKKLSFKISTYHEGICDCCGVKKAITEARDFYYPNKDAIKVIIKYLKK